MKFNLLIFCFSILSGITQAQSTFDKSLNEISADIADKLSQKNKKKIVVLYVTDINKAQTVAGKYIADVLSVNIVNNQGNFEVFDRENLSGIAEAKKMLAEGYIDASQAKELGQILAVEAIIIGNYTVLTSTLKLTLKALDVNNGFVIAASMKDLPINEDVGSLLGINVSGSVSNTNRGFNNRPLNSNEDYNNPELVNKACENSNTGDYCFCNTTNDNFIVSLNANGTALQLSPGQTQCLYNLAAKSYTYHIMGDHDYGRGGLTIYGVSSKYWYVHGTGQFLVEKCKSKSFTIK